MSNVWVSKLDGALQFHPEIPKITLIEARDELSGLIGGAQILRGEPGSRIFPSKCGFPEGGYNAFEITAEGWNLLEAAGEEWKHGFYLLDETTVKSVDLTLDLMIGMRILSQPALRSGDIPQVRVFQLGDHFTKDFVPGRCNIEIDESRTVLRVWIES